MINVMSPGQEKLIKETVTLKGPKDPSCVGWRGSEGETIVGYESGKVLVWRTQYSRVSCRVRIMA